MKHGYHYLVFYFISVNHLIGKWGPKYPIYAKFMGFTLQYSHCLHFCDSMFTTQFHTDFAESCDQSLYQMSRH